MKLILFILAELVILLGCCWGNLNYIGELNVLLCEKEFRGKRVKMPRYLFVPRKGMDVPSKLFPFSGLSRQDDGKVYFLTLLLTIINYLVPIPLLAVAIILYLVAEWHTLSILLLVLFSELFYFLIISTVYEIIEHKSSKKK